MNLLPIGDVPIGGESLSPTPSSPSAPSIPRQSAIRPIALKSISFLDLSESQDKEQINKIKQVPIAKLNLILQSPIDAAHRSLCASCFSGPSTSTPEQTPNLSLIPIQPFAERELNRSLQSPAGNLPRIALNSLSPPLGMTHVKISSKIGSSITP